MKKYISLFLSALVLCTSYVSAEDTVQAPAVENPAGEEEQKDDGASSDTNEVSVSSAETEDETERK